ncbi:hypothetical protein FQR65_LT17241 [Abscondita terminalis]|nr:hypothetical protein FQR65_LT17241 [Abscondita terminalis]
MAGSCFEQGVNRLDFAGAAGRDDMKRFPELACMNVTPRPKLLDHSACRPGPAAILALMKPAALADLVHARAPVEGVRAPQGGKHPVLAVLLLTCPRRQWQTGAPVLRIRPRARNMSAFLAGAGSCVLALALERPRPVGARLAQPEHIGSQRGQQRDSSARPAACRSAGAEAALRRSARVLTWPFWRDRPGYST